MNVNNEPNKEKENKSGVSHTKRGRSLNKPPLSNKMKRRPTKK